MALQRVNPAAVVVPSTFSHEASSPAPDELNESPLKKSPLAIEVALPESVDAPVLDADWANAGVASEVDTASPVAMIADMIASIIVVFFIVLCEWINSIYVSRRTMS
jgi:hypothetical protein